MTRPTEYDLQRALCIWLDGNPDRNGVLRATPSLASNVVYFHVPNGGGRNAAEAARFKAVGVKAGVPDLVFLAYQRFYLMEMKEPSGRGVLSPAQREMHGRLLSAGATALAVIDNLPDAKAWCIHHGLAINC